MMMIDDSPGYGRRLLIDPPVAEHIPSMLWNVLCVSSADTLSLSLFINAMTNLITIFIMILRLQSLH